MGNFNNARAKKCREDLNLSSSYVAGLLGITNTELNEIEEGLKKPNVHIVEMMTTIFGVSEKYLNEDSLQQKSPYFARNRDQLTEFDQEQVLDFLAFQREISKQIRNDR